MGILKRVCLFVFGLSGLVCLAALALTYYGPWTSQATLFMMIDEYYVAVECLALITAVGLLACLLRSIFQRNRKTVEVAQSGGDKITVSLDAIASQASHVIEADGEFRAKRVSVRAKARGHVRVFARVQPASTVDVVAASEDLHASLMEGLSIIVGDNVDAVELEFVEAGEFRPTDEIRSGEDVPAAYGADDPSFEIVAADQDQDGITVPITRYSAPSSDDADTPEEA